MYILLEKLLEKSSFSSKDEEAKIEDEKAKIEDISFQVFVKTLTGTTITLTVESSCSVSTFKRLVKQKTVK